MPAFYLLVQMVWPYVISSRFNAPRSYPFAPQRLQLHEGIDFAPRPPVSGALEVRASQRGIVDKIGFDAKGYGNYVRIVHEWGTERYVTWYAHLAQATTHENAYVNAGDTIGIAGSTGNSTGIHVHLTLQHIGKGLKNYVVDDVVDPEPFLVASLVAHDEAWWVADVTIPDGTPLTAGQKFRKTWRVRNSGTTPWGSGYQLAYAGNLQMNGPAAVPLPAAKPGEDVEVSVDLVAPATPGALRSTWRPRAPDGAWFDYAQYAEINVQPQPGVDEMRYVDDETIPYDTNMKPGQPFRKTWRIRNTGSAAWGSGYQFVFVGDEQMGGPDVVPLPPTQPGVDALVSVDLVAPMKAGKARGTWQARDPEGTLFNYPVRVEIVVVPSALIENAAFVADVVVLQPGATYLKTWRIMNTGQSRWGEGYVLACVGGDAMGAPATIPLPDTKPLLLADISVKFTAPPTPGVYQSRWALRSPDGQTFGPVFYAQVEVRA